MDQINKRGLSEPVVSKLCSSLMGIKMNLRDTPGTFIGSGSSKVIYTPPEGKKLIAKKLDSLILFLEESTLDPLLAICLAHYQFEAIHPFSDGNGRTGRMLNVLVMVQKQLLTKPILAPSFEINTNRATYYKLLEEVTSRGAFKAWVLFMLKIFEDAAIRSLSQIEAVMELERQFLETKTAVFSSGIDSQLVQLLLLQPYARIGHLVDSLGLSRPTAAKYLEDLESAGLLKSVIRGRDKYFVNIKMIEILEGKQLESSKGASEK